MTDEDTRTVAPPYISFRSLNNMLDRFKSEGLPRRIDRSYWGSFLSGSTGAQTMVALRSLGLVDASDSPTELLERVSDESASAEDRKRILAEVLQQRYPDVIALDLARASWGQLEEVFKQKYNLDGETRRKAMTFFINAAQYANIPLSNHITKRTRTRVAPARSNTRAAPRKTPRNGVGAPGEGDPSAQEDEQKLVNAKEGLASQSRSVQLRSRGVVTLSYAVDLFDLDEEDHRFLWGLIEVLRGYGTGDERGFPQQDGRDPGREIESGPF